MLWSTARKPARLMLPHTHLTQSHRRQAKGKLIPPIADPPRPPRLCQTCGVKITPGHRFCSSCAATISTERYLRGEQQGRDASHSSEAQARRVETSRRHTAARRAWLPSNQPAWLNEQSYREKIYPRLAGVTVRALASALGISIPYASNIRS